MSSYSTNEFRSGLKIILDGDPYTIVENEFVKPGKGQAFNRVRIRNLRSGRTLERSFRSGETVEAADVVETDMQYLYNDGDFWHFMVPDTFEQHTAGKDAMGETAMWLKDGTTCKVMLWNGVPLGIDPPAHVELKIIETDPGLRGDTATGGQKSAKLETGAVVRVPLFLNEGEVIRVDTRTGEYLARGRNSVAARCSMYRRFARRRSQVRPRIAATRTCTSTSSPRASSASKRACNGLSRSSTPINRSPSRIGTTTSEFDAESQAIWPGKSCTSGTTTVSRRAAAVPQTPVPIGMRMQAGLPWNGPSSRSPVRGSTR